MKRRVVEDDDSDVETEQPTKKVLLSALRALPKKPVLPQQRELTRPHGFLRPHTHPFAKDEVKVILRSDACQHALQQTVTAEQMLATMKLLANQAYKIVHVGGNAMSYWLDNVKAELRTHETLTSWLDAAAEPVEYLRSIMRCWLRRFNNGKSLFAGLLKYEPEHNEVVCPVEYHLFVTERKKQILVTKAALSRIATWEAKYGKAVREYEARRYEAEVQAQEKASAVAHKAFLEKPRLGSPQSFVFEGIEKSIAKSTATSELQLFPSKATLEEMMGYMRSKNVRVAGLVEHYKVEHLLLAKFCDEQIWLRNAWESSNAAEVFMKKELAGLRAIQQKVNVVLKHRTSQRTRVIWEYGTLMLTIREAKDCATRVLKETMASNYPTQTDLVWKSGCFLWYTELASKAQRCETLKDDLEKRRVSLSDFSIFLDKCMRAIVAMLYTHTKNWSNIPAPKEDCDESDDLECTGVVTREERDEKGWAQAEVLD